MLRELASARFRTLMLGRMSAPERVATFLLDMFERRDAARAVDLPMSRNDIADYLGLTIETVCRVMSALKRAGAIAIPTPHSVELRNRAALAAIGERVPAATARDGPVCVVDDNVWVCDS